jgi:hypothetical protein
MDPSVQTHAPSTPDVPMIKTEERPRVRRPNPVLLNNKNAHLLVDDSANPSAGAAPTTASPAVQRQVSTYVP